MKTLTPAQQNWVLSLLGSHTPGHEIHRLTGISVGTISNLCKKHFPNLSKSQGGRPSKLSPANVYYSICQITTSKVDNASQLTNTLSNIINQPLSHKTVRRALKAAGMKAVVKKKRPKLTARHRRERMDFAIAHRDWTIEDWKCVVWSDETKINCLGSDGRVWVWKRAGEQLNPRLVQETTKFGGGSIMFWGCMFWEGVGYGTRIDGRMDADLYTQIMEDELLKSLEYYSKDKEDILFQQDNDPKHTSKKAKRWFENHEIQVMHWPSQSPDLNPIEHLWHHLKNKVGAIEPPPPSLEELWGRVQVEWDKIGKEVCQNLIESMPRRMQAVIQAKGGYTKY
jgi:transposase